MTLLAFLQGSAFCAGLAMGIASMLSVGPNTINLIREGLTDGHVGLVATTVWVSRMSLLSSALILADLIVSAESFVRPALSWLGFVALCWFAFSSLRTYLQTDRVVRMHAPTKETTSQCARRILAVFWLNPLTYIEMLFVPAAVGASFVMPSCRILFIAGLIAMTTTSCYGYAFGGRACAPYFREQNTLKLFDLLSGLILSGLAVAMAIGLALHPT